MPRRNWKNMFQGGDDMSPLAITQLESLEDDLAALQGGGGGSQTLLSTTTLASPASFDVSGIAQTANDLLLVAIVRAADIDPDIVLLRVNNDSAANYYHQRMLSTGAANSAAENRAVTSIQLRDAPGGTNSYAGSFAVFNVTLFGYASTAWKKAVQFETFDLTATATSGMVSTFGGGFWDSTAAINRVQLRGTNTANFATGSQLRIYGRT